jgi:hypothetical protein
MQDRYAGDVGDFGKFGLLRHLLHAQAWRLGVVWYLYPDEQHNADGRHIAYLDKAAFRDCDAALHEALAGVVRRGRSVAALQRAALLPRDTVYYDAPLDFHLRFAGRQRAGREARRRARQDWLRSACEMTRVCDALFVDPDNGLEIASCAHRHLVCAGKYAFYDEIAQLAAGKALCVVYHHLNRSGRHGGHAAQIRRRMLELRTRVRPHGAIFALRYRAYSPRAYFLLCDGQCDKFVAERLDEMMRGPWAPHWDNVRRMPA